MMKAQVMLRSLGFVLWLVLWLGEPFKSSEQSCSIIRSALKQNKTNQNKKLLRLYRVGYWKVPNSMSLFLGPILGPLRSIAHIIL